MSTNTHIQWTDATWNPTTGCTKVSPGCANCYIASTPPFRMNGRKFDEKGHIPLILHEDRLTTPLTWAKPRRVFVNSLSDLFHEDIPDDFIAEVYGVMVASYWHVFQVLTKRPERRRRLLADAWFRTAVARHATAYINKMRGPDPQGQARSKSLAATMSGLAQWWATTAPNIWEGVTVENQHFADERIPILLDTPAAVRFLSCEPLLGRVVLTDMHCWKGWGDGEEWEQQPVRPGHMAGLDWVIVGGESGPNARPTDIEHIRSVVQQCLTAGVPVFCKQLGANPIDANDGSPVMALPVSIGDYRGKRLYHLKDRKGGTPEEWPEDLRIRQFPAVRP